MKIDRDNPLAREIQQEMASAYFAACRKMVNSLEALRVFDAAARRPHDQGQTTHRRQLIEEAAERVYFVVIQREAMELPADPAFFERYEVPHEVRARLGTKRRSSGA